MQHESFEDEEVASVLNSDFVSIKVDREERPDVDHIYMSACQALTGRGGWPLTAFLTADKKPFYVGTYFPKHDRPGMAGLLTLLDRVITVWKNNREALMDSGEKITAAIVQEPSSVAALPDGLADMAFSEFERAFDNIYGGFGTAPKFPSPHNLCFLLRYRYATGNARALEMVEKTLAAMRRGGIYDHIGFGFCRYSTDSKWLVPHFEKMLYDNALLAIAYLEAYQTVKKPEYAETAEEIFTYVLRDMTSPEGGFYSAEDADSEGEEGKFYVWTPDDVEEVLGKADGKRFCRLFNITAEGNFEGKSIPNYIRGALDGDDRSFAKTAGGKLFTYREKRVRPLRDDKILTGWNGLMLAALAAGGRILGSPAYVSAAGRAADFILKRLMGKNGRLMARYRDGNAAYPAYAEDYAFLVWGLIELYEAAYRPEHLRQALRLNEELLDLFWDAEAGGLFLYGSDGERLITRPKESYDGAVPSANSVSALNMLRLARLTGDSRYEDTAQRLFQAFGGNLSAAPVSHSHMLSAVLYSRAVSKEIIIVDEKEPPGGNEMIRIVNESFRPFDVSVYCSGDRREMRNILPFIDNYRPLDGRTTAYVCESFACRSPLTDADAFRQMLSQP